MTTRILTHLSFLRSSYHKERKKENIATIPYPHNSPDLTYLEAILTQMKRSCGIATGFEQPMDFKEFFQKWENC